MRWPIKSQNWGTAPHVAGAAALAGAADPRAEGPECRARRKGQGVKHRMPLPLIRVEYLNFDFSD